MTATATDTDLINCDLAPGCDFTGPWTDYLDHAPAHPLPHPDDRPAWLAARRTFIGASEIGTVCGLSPWDNALSVYAAKVLGTEKADNPNMERGRDFEPVLLTRYARRHGVTLDRPASMRHPTMPWIAATPDALTPTGRAVQIKTVKGRMCRFWEDGPPLYAVLQVQQELAVFGLSEAHLVAFMGDDLIEREYEIAADPDMFASAVQLAGGFWQESVRGRALPTEFDGPTSAETLRALFPMALDLNLDEASAEEVDLARRYDNVRESAKECEELKEELASQLKARIGDRPGFFAGSVKRPDVKATWANNKDGIDKEAILRVLLARLSANEVGELEAAHSKPGARVLRVTVR